MANVSHVPHYGEAYLAEALKITKRTRREQSILQNGNQIAAAAAAAAEAEKKAQDAYWRSLKHPHQPSYSPPPDYSYELTKEQLAETSNWFRNDPEPPLYLSFSS